jgi:hypothetical protein
MIKDAPVRTIDFAKALADVGIIPYSMMNSITGFKVVCDPAAFVTIQLDVVLDERIYKIMNPRVRKLFTVDAETPTPAPTASIHNGSELKNV